MTVTTIDYANAVNAVMNAARDTGLTPGHIGIDFHIQEVTLIARGGSARVSIAEAKAVLAVLTADTPTVSDPYGDPPQVDVTASVPALGVTVKVIATPDAPKEDRS